MTSGQRKSIPGRPRSDTTRQAILDAALELVGEVGYPRTTVDGIAQRAGAGKQTIYRWWSGKAEVVLEALTSNAARAIPLPDLGDLRSDLYAFLRATFRAGRRAGIVPVLKALMAEAQLDEAFAEAFRTRFLEHRREALAQLLRQYPDQLRTSEAVALDVVFGALWYRGLVGHAPLNDALARELTDLLT